MELYRYIILFGTGVIFIAFIVSLFFSKIKKPGYFIYVFWFILLGILISLNTICNKIFEYTSINLFQATQSFLIFLQAIISLKIFYIFFLFKNFKKLYYTFVLLYAIVLIFNIVTEFKFVMQHAIQALGPIVFSVYYFHNLFKANFDTPLLQRSDFWIVVGYFIYGSTSFPVYALHNFIYVYNPQKFGLSKAIFSISNISLIFLYLCLIKAYLCLKNPQPNTY
jgi:hypothetical protein